MKTNAIVRIILFSLAILVLAGILATALSIDLFMVRDGSDSSALPMAKEGSTNSSVADADLIRNIEIEWAAGHIEICPDKNASNITVVETNNAKDKYDMVCKTSGDTLRVQFSEESIRFPSFGITVDISKDLVITVPEDWTCDTLEVDAASASLNITGMSIDQVDFDGASGNCLFDHCHVGTLDVDTASGDIDFTGTLDTLECDAVSANFRGEFDETPYDLRFDGVSGDLDLTFPEDCGFTVALDSLSGDFKSDFPTTLSGDHHTYGDGSCHIEVDGVSGDITIRSSSPISSNADQCTISNCTDSTHHHSDKHH